jgi:hypothetical protein
MLVKSLSALAMLAVAVSAADLQPYKAQPKIMKMSVRDLFGVERRDDGYQPSQSVCGTGATCAEACGAGYDTCVSRDNSVHCYNPKAAETCCPDESGNSCDAGYYCAGDNKAETWCCPNGMDLAACAAAYSIPGPLTSEAPKPTTSIVISTSTAINTTTSTSTTSSSTTTTSTTVITTSASRNATKTAYVTNSTITTPCTSTIAGSATLPVANTTSSVKVVTPTSSLPAQISANAGNVMAPAGAFALFAAAGLAALL